MRFEPLTIENQHERITVSEDSCMCGSCDTVNVIVFEKFDESIVNYNTEFNDWSSRDPYDLCKELKSVCLELAKEIRSLRAEKSKWIDKNDVPN
jgi:hypothetical protein